MDYLLLQLSKFKYLIFQNDKCGDDGRNNLDVDTGGWRTLDLKSTVFHNRLKDFELVEEIRYYPYAGDLYFKEVLMFKNLTAHRWDK